MAPRGGGHGVAVFFHAADCARRACRGEIERLELFPQAIELTRENRRAAYRTWRAHMAPLSLKPSWRAAFVGKLDVADENPCGSALADGVPAGPRLLQGFRIAALGDDLAELFEILATGGTAGTVLALAVGAFHSGGDAA